ncbi:hypothetical protein V502_10041 [Pseudogymnoascus sp. VKM F-4520 (FW-2644)]|nr:hypothetical protein V502_10041 [Pseudogymnoascus sp. VKM F-4520 (FW-2644)]
MAPSLPESSHQMIRDMIVSKCDNVEIAKAAHCSRVTVRNIRLNLNVYGNTKAPPNGGGRKRSITPAMLDALRDILVEKARFTSVRDEGLSPEGVRGACDDVALLRSNP